MAVMAYVFDMKRIVLTAMLLAGLLAVSPAAAKAPRMEFEAKSHKFGEISENAGPVSCTFRFVNTGDEPLVVKKVETSCVCTKAVFPRRPVMPGASGEVTVTYNPKGRPGAFYKAIKVLSNTSSGTEVLTVGGTVSASKSGK